MIDVGGFDESWPLRVVGLALSCKRDILAF